MKESKQHALGNLLVQVGEQMRQGFDTPVKLNCEYVTFTNDFSTALKIEILIKADGAGDSDPINCTEIVQLLYLNGWWDRA